MSLKKQGEFGYITAKCRKPGEVLRAHHREPCKLGDVV